MYPNLELELFKRKISRKELAQKLEISVSALQKKLSGRNEFTLREVKKILECMPGITWEYLFKEVRETA